jgi:probable poly-beta-1,6-N-acetyl-D-glucosamine export protein
VTSVLQPIMTFYSLAAIAFFFWLAYRWAGKIDQAGHPRGYRNWGTVSDASFGIYLIHAIFLNWFMLSLVPAMPRAWPVAMRVFLTWFITAGCATLASIALMNMPILSRLVGRKAGEHRLQGEHRFQGDHKGRPYYATMEEGQHSNHKR